MHIFQLVLCTAAIPFALTASGGSQAANATSGSPIFANTSNLGIFLHTADTSHATTALVDFMYGYFAAKNLHKPSAWTDCFHPEKSAYGDVGLGNLFTMPALAPEIALLESFWAKSSRSFPLRIMGDMKTGAVVHMVDTADMFGDELRILVTLDFEDGTVVREVDYWDTRGNSVAAQRVSAAQYPSNFLESVVQARPHPILATVVDNLSSALQVGDIAAIADLLDYNSVLEDLSLRTRIDGVRAISRYLERGFTDLPYGDGSSVRHIVGSARGGAYEWDDSEGRKGVTALELDDEGFIGRLTIMWDTFTVRNATMRALTTLALDQ
jgi:hypothetical protein